MVLYQRDQSGLMLILVIKHLLDNHPEDLSHGHHELLLGHNEHGKLESSKSSGVCTICRMH